MRRSAHSSKYRYLLSPPQRPLCVMGRLGRKKKRARGERIARAFSMLSIIAIVIGLPRSLRGGNSVYLCKRKYSAGSRPWDKQIRPWGGGGGGRSYIRLHSGKTSLTRENKADCSESSGCGDFNIRLDAVQADPPFLLLTQKDKRQLCSLGGYRTAKRLCKYTVVFMTSLSWSSDRGRLYRKCILQHALASLKGSALK